MDRLVTILKLAYFYEMEEAKAFAIREIEIQTRSSSCENAMQLLALAHRYDVGDWLTAAFVKLLHQCITSFSKEEVDAIGARTMLCLAKTTDAIEEFKKHLAQFPPPVQHHIMCSQHSLCSKAYDEKWWSHVGRALLDPGVLISAISVPSFVRKFKFAGMTEGCLMKTMDAATDTLIFHTEDKIIECVVQKLKGVEGFKSDQ